MRSTIGGPPGDARIIEPSGEALPVTLSDAEPGIWRAEIAIRRAGLYRAENGGLVAFVNAGQPNPREFRQVVSTVSDLTPIAESTGGSVRRLYPNGTLVLPRLVDIRSGTRFSGSDYIGLRPTEASILRGVSVLPLGLGFLGLGLLLIPILATWLAEGLRRRRPTGG